MVNTNIASGIHQVNHCNGKTIIASGIHQVNHCNCNTNIGSGIHQVNYSIVMVRVASFQALLLLWFNISGIIRLFMLWLASGIHDCSHYVKHFTSGIFRLFMLWLASGFTFSYLCIGLLPGCHRVLWLPKKVPGLKS